MKSIDKHFYFIVKFRRLNKFSGNKMCAEKCKWGKNTTAFVQRLKLTDLFFEAAMKCTQKKDVCFCLNLSVKSFRIHTIHRHRHRHAMHGNISGMALEHAHFQFSRINRTTDRPKLQTGDSQTTHFT